MYALYKWQKKRRNEQRQRRTSPSEENEGRPPTGVVSTPFANDMRPGPTTEQKNPSNSPEDVAETKRRRIYRRKIILGLAAPFALQALDTTIIASALPFIATDFHELGQLNWIVSAFNLTSAAFLFFWSQLSDIFGRHVTVQSAIVVMLVGSAICTGAPTSAFSVLLLGRGIQGVGAAGVNISVRTILADRVSLEDYAINWTIFVIVASGSFSIGPVIGGYLTEASWRWCFAINLPIGVLAIVVVLLLLRRELLGPQPIEELEGYSSSGRANRIRIRLSTIDYGGQMMFLCGVGLLTLSLTWGGTKYPWKSAAVLTPLILGSILCLFWLIYEHSMSSGRRMSRMFSRQRPMIPWDLLSQHNIGLLFLINFAIGQAMFAIMYFMDLFFVLVEKKSSGSAGVGLLYFLPGLGVGAYMAMFSSNVWPRQTLPALILGGVTSAVGITVLPWAIESQQTNVTHGMMALVGHGVGIRMNPGMMHGLAYFPKKTAQIACLVAFAMPFGGLVGLTIMSTVYTNTTISGHLDAKDGIKWAFVAMIPFMWLCLLLTTFLGNVWILKGEGRHEVVHNAYLWSLMFRKQLTKEVIACGDDSRREVATDSGNEMREDVKTATERPLELHEGN